MILQRVNRDDPEKVFIVVKNSYDTASLTNGQAVCWDWTADADGVAVSIPTATENVCGGTDFAGVVAETIATGDYGLIQVYGYHSAAKVRTMTDSGHVYHESLQEVAAGSRLVAGISAAFVLEAVTVAETAQVLDSAGFSFAAQAATTSAATAIFIKAM